VFKVQHNQIKSELKKTQAQLVAFFDQKERCERDASEIAKQRATSSNNEKYAAYVEARLAALRACSKRLSESRARMFDVKNCLNSKGLEKLFT